MTVHEKLYEKMEQEWKEYTETFEKMPLAEKLEHLYESLFKQEILESVRSVNFTVQEAKALLSDGSPLDTLYRGWLDTDFSYMDLIEDSMRETASALAPKVKEKEMER